MQKTKQQSNHKNQIDILLDCTLLINGAEAFPRILQRLQEARKEIIISMFVWRDDAIGNDMAQAVLDAADRGVRVKIIKDKLAAIHELEEESRKSFFHSSPGLSLFLQRRIMALLYFRYLGKRQKSAPNPLPAHMQAHPNITLDTNTVRHDHSKFYLIDNRVLIMGGINIEDKELYADKRKLKYADYMVEVRSATEIAEFRKSVIEQTGADPASMTSFCVNSRHTDRFLIKPKLLALLDQAQESIDFEMAYWGDRDVTDKIIECANRGVHISIITSRASNLQNDYNLKVMAYLLKTSNHRIEIYLSNRMVHSKFICIDNKLIFFGSANFNRPGLSKLSELNILLDDPKTIQKWIQWRKAHVQECTRVEDYRAMNFNRFIALIEGLFA